MSRPELFLEHHKATGRERRKTPRRVRITPERKMFVIGSSPEADLRLNGEEVMGCHAVLQFKNGQWFLRSFAVDSGAVSVNDETVVEAALSEKSTVKIGTHRLELFSKQRTENLFKTEKAPSAIAAARPQPLSLHQIVISKKGKVQSTHLVKAGESFAFFDGEKTIRMASPTTAEWIETTVGTRLVRQRLVSGQETLAADGLHLDQDLKRPMLAAALLMLLLLGLAVILPKPSAQPDLVLDQKSIDMIFNAEKIKQKRTEAKKVVQAAKMRSGGTSDSSIAAAPSNVPDQSMAPTKSDKATAALTSIRNAGLSALVGKIAKRANKNGPMVGATGVVPDVGNSGRALFSNGTTTTGGGGAAAVAGDSYRLGGIATRGKGGGATGVKEGTALSGGKVGMGDVAMVDEETVIEGGLDRDVIADVIKRNLGQIRYCYERQLSSNPDLYGKLLVRFTIDSAGTVMEPKIDTSTLKSSLVEGCVLRRLAGWKFPLPKGGTQVRVSYPFLFKALD